MDDKDAKLYAVRNDRGEYLSLTDDGEPVWYQGAGNFATNKAFADDWASMGGHVVAFVEEPEKVVVSEEEAQLLEALKREPSYYHPASNIANFTYGEHNRSLGQLRLITAFVNGYTVRKEPHWLVKVPDKWTGDTERWWRKEQDGTLTWGVFSNPLEEYEFTESELKAYHLDQFWKMNVTGWDD